jgi:hypothetical protein
MKTQGNNGQRLYRQANKRWKWMAGATAATAAGVTVSQAGAITINLLNNYISATGGNHLNADLTGDGAADLMIANAFNATHMLTTTSVPGYTVFTARVNLNGVLASAARRNSGNPFNGTERLGSLVAHFGVTGPTFTGTYSLTGSIPLSFKDLHINGGALTTGLLQVTVSTRHGADVRLDSFTYNDIPITPDRGSSLSLLAMGAGGVLALRRSRSARGPA